MDPRAPWPLLWGSVFALPTAALTAHSLPAAALLAIVGLCFARWSPSPHRLAGLCALPALLAAINVPSEPPPWPRPGPVSVAGEVASVVRAPLSATTFVRLRHGGPDVRLQCDGDLEVLPGDRLAATARLSLPAAPDLPPTLHAPAATVRIEPGPPSLQRLAAAVRRALELQLLALVPGENGAMLATLVLGRGTLAAADLTAAHQATGLSHLLAVSGAHAAMLAWLLGLSVARRGARLAVGRARTAAVLVVLAAYAAITGGEPPVLRAVVTFALAALANQLGRPFGIAAGLLAPALLTCLVQPEALLGPSFLLSYAAVCGLALAGGSAQGPWTRRWLWEPLRASLWATLLTAPLTLYWFGQLAPWTVLLTPLLAPLVAALLLGGLVTAGLGCLAPGLVDGPAAALRVLAELYATAVHTADHLPATPVHACTVPPGWLLLLAGVAGFLVVERRRTRRSVAAAALLLMAPHFVPLGRLEGQRFRLFAVGHGQASLFHTGSGHQVAIDCGSLQHPTLAARRVVQGLVRRHLDLLVVTHADQDHHNGVAGLLQRLPIREALLPSGLRGSPLHALLAAHGTTMRWLEPGENMEPLPGLFVAAPLLPAGASDNDLSLWATLQVGSACALLTGDAEALGVAAALAQGMAPRCDLLVLPHHGRGNPLGATLLHAVRPAACFASAALADGDTALGALARRFGADVWTTGQHGTLELIAHPMPHVRASEAGRRLAAPR